eukprot:gene31241-biopygen6115
MSTLDRMRDVRAATSILENLHNVQDLVPPALYDTLPDSVLGAALDSLLACRSLVPDKHLGLSRLDGVIIPLTELVRELEIMEVYEDLEMPGRATVSRNPYQAAMDDVMCSVFCERSVVYSASKTLFNLHYLSVTDELVPHDAMSSGRFYGGLNRILFPVIVKADPIMCEAAEPLHQFKISMMYDTGSTLTYMTLEVLHALGCKNAVYPPDPKLPHSEHMYEVCISGISTQVGLCPKTRCEHVCLLGQQFLMDSRMHVAIDYVTRTACMKRSYS